MNWRIDRLNQFGWQNFYETQYQEAKKAHEFLIPARITEVHKEQYGIVSEKGEQRAKLKTSLFFSDRSMTFPTVGDFVLIQYNPIGESVIYQVLNRKSLFSRLDTCNNIEQIVAANFDYVFLMTSLNHDFNIKRIERYLAQAWQSGASPVIILTKADLCDHVEAYLDQLENVAFGVPIIEISSVTKQGFDQLEAYVKPGKTIVFLGSSGVGKSSLVNALSDRYAMEVSGIREDDARGRHTTTYRQLIHLASGAMIIDTPGMRELGLWGSEDGLDAAFEDIDSLQKACRFSDCKHQKEPGCAVQQALKNGELSRSRWDSYLKLKKELVFTARKEKLAELQKAKVGKIAEKKAKKKDRKAWVSEIRSE